MPVYAAKKCAANAAHTVGLHNVTHQPPPGYADTTRMAGPAETRGQQDAGVRVLLVTDGVREGVVAGILRNAHALEEAVVRLKLISCEILYREMCTAVARSRRTSSGAAALARAISSRLTATILSRIVVISA